MATSCCQIEFLRQLVAELENDRTEQAAEFLRQPVAEILEQAVPELRLLLHCRNN